MSAIHSYYITSQLFQLVEEQVASIEVDKKLRPLASVFVRLFDDLDYNFSNELVAEALERLIIFIQKEDTISTVEFSKVDAFFTDDKNQLFVRVDDVAYLVVEPSEIDEDDDFFEEGQEFEENKEISLDDDDSYIIIDEDEVIEEYELNEEITLDDENSYLIIEDSELEDFDEHIHNLDFEAIPIVLDHNYAELITLASTTDLDELLYEQLDDLPAFKEVIDQLYILHKEVKKESKKEKKDKKDSKKDKKSKKKKHKSKKDKKEKKSKDSKKDLALKIEKKLFKYIKEKELGEELLAEFIQLKKQIDYILIQY
jgi:hypothetical protein